jgi:hypothetical protein
VSPLCAGQPTEYWTSLGDDGNRLALAVCRVCPCRNGDQCVGPDVVPDPRPAGVIRAGIAWSDTGKLLPLCDACGYPVVGYAGGDVSCRRCAIPEVSIPDPKQVRGRRIRLLVAEGMSDDELATALGIRRAAAQTARLRAGAKRRPWTRAVRVVGDSGTEA